MPAPVQSAGDPASNKTDRVSGLIEPRSSLRFPNGGAIDIWSQMTLCLGGGKGWETTLYIVGCLAASLPSTHEMPAANPPPSYDKQECLQTLSPGVRGVGAKLPWELLVQPNWIRILSPWNSPGDSNGGQAEHHHFSLQIKCICIRVGGLLVEMKDIVCPWLAFCPGNVFWCVPWVIHTGSSAGRREHSTAQQAVFHCWIICPNSNIVSFKVLTQLLWVLLQTFIKAKPKGQPSRTGYRAYQRLCRGQSPK